MVALPCGPFQLAVCRSPGEDTAEQRPDDPGRSGPAPQAAEALHHLAQTKGAQGVRGERLVAGEDGQPAKAERACCSAMNLGGARAISALVAVPMQAPPVTRMPFASRKAASRACTASM